MSRKLNDKREKRRERKIKPSLLIAAEGRHLTETNYFNGFKGYDSPYNIVFVPGNATDPKMLLSNTVRYWKRMGFNDDDGDLAAVVVDMDSNPYKAKLLNDLIDNNPEIRFLISNPTIEIWFLFHFQKNPKRFSNSKNLMNELSKYLKDYEKSRNYNQILIPKTKEAISNSQQKAVQQDKHYRWPSVDCNPRTNIHEIVQFLLPHNKD